METREICAIIFMGVIVLIIPSFIEAGEWYNASQDTKEYKLLSPATLKRGTKMNWVGCVLTWLALGIVSPCMFLYKCIYNLFHI